jgi:hypothetical protein
MTGSSFILEGSGVYVLKYCQAVYRFLLLHSLYGGLS